MKIRRRQLLHLAAGAAALPAMSLIARAQSYPTRQVHLITGFAAGDPNDTTVRLIGRWLSKRLRQHFVIENRTGTGGNVAVLSSDLLLSVSQRGRR
jgi:tripartite-type tricarboxylate transporter receptor subunit TctC